MTWLVPVAHVTEIQAAHINQFSAWLQGTRAEPGNILYDSNAAATLKLRNSHASGVSLQVRNQADTADLITAGPTTVTIPVLSMTTLNVSGTATVGALVGGTVAGTTGTFSGAVSGTTGTFSGAIIGTSVRVNNDTYYLARNQIGNADLSLLKATTADHTLLNAGTGKQILLGINGVTQAALNAMGSGGLVVGTGSFPTDPTPAAEITSPLAGSIRVGTTASPSSTNAPAFTISAITTGNVDDGVGTALSVYAVKGSNTVDTTGVKSTDAINVWTAHAANIPGNLSNVYGRGIGKYTHKYTTAATVSGWSRGVTDHITSPVINTTFTLSSGGSGYTRNPEVRFYGGGLPATGNHATATATINSSGVVTAVTLTGVGSGYTSDPTIVIAPPGGSVFSSAWLAGRVDDNYHSGVSGAGTRFLETIGLEINPYNVSGINASADYAISSFYGTVGSDIADGRSIGISAVATGGDSTRAAQHGGDTAYNVPEAYNTVGIVIDSQSAGVAFYQGLDIRPGALAATAGHAANIPGTAVRIPNAAWYTAFSGLPASKLGGSTSINTPWLPLTIPLLGLNAADDTVLNADSGKYHYFTTGRPGASGAGTLTTLAAILGNTGFVIGPTASMSANNALNVDQTNKRVGIGMAPVSYPLEVAGRIQVPNNTAYSSLTTAAAGVGLLLIDGSNNTVVNTASGQSTVIANNSTAVVTIPSTGIIEVTQTTAGGATAGAIAVAATFVEFLKVKVNGVDRRIPLYNP